MLLDNEFACLRWEVAAEGPKQIQGGLRNPEPEVGVVSSFWDVGALNPPEVGMLWESLTPLWGSQESLSSLGQESPPGHRYPAQHPSLSSQLRSSASRRRARLCLSLFSFFPVHISGNPTGFSGVTQGPLLAPHPSSFRAPCGRRKVSPPNKFRLNLQVKKNVFFCS